MEPPTLRKLAGLLLVACCGVSLAACGAASKAGKDQELDAALREINLFTEELVKRVEASAGGPARGVDEAQKYLDARRDEIRGRVEAIRRIGDAELSAEARRRKLESLNDDLFRVTGLSTKFMSESMADPAFKSKLDQLVSDYRALVEA